MPDLLLRVELRLTNGQCHLWVIRVGCGPRLQQRMSVAPQKRQLATKVRRVVKGHFQSHALQQSRGSVEIAGQAFSSSSNALASFRSRVSNPSVNQP